MRAARFAISGMLLLGGLIQFAWTGEPTVAKLVEPPKLDATGDPLPPGAFARFGTIRLRHDAKAVAFLDNQTIASVGSSICLWDAATGRLIRQHRHEKLAEVACAAICADGSRAITRNNQGRYCVWEIGSGRLIREFKSTSKNWNVAQPLKSISASADGSQIVALEWDVDGKDAMGRAIVYWTNGIREPIKLKTGPNDVRACVISSDGTRVLTLEEVSARDQSGRQILELWNTSAGNPIRTDDLDVHRIHDIQIAPDSNLVAIAGEKGVVLRTTEGKELWRRAIESGRTNIACLTANRLALLEANQARIVDSATGGTLARCDTPGGSVSAAAISPDGKQLVTAQAERLHIMNLIDGKEIAGASGHSNGICMMRVTPDGRFLAAADDVDRHVHLWDLSTGRLVRRFEGIAGGFGGGSRIDISPDGKLLAAFSGNVGRVWEVATGKEVFGQTEHEELVLFALHFLGDSQRLALAFCSERIRVIDCPSGKVDCELRASAHDLVDRGFTFHPDGRLLAISPSFFSFEEDKQALDGIVVWDVLNKRVLRHIDCYHGEWFSCAVSRDFRTLATLGADGAIRFWELSTGQERMTIKTSMKPHEPSRWTRTLAFSADGLTLVVVRQDNSEVDLWDVPSGSKFGSLRGHDRPVNTIEFTPDGKSLLTGSEDTTILGWDMTRPELRSRPLTSKLTDNDLSRHWERLRSLKAEEAHRSKWAMAGDLEKTVAFFREKLFPKQSLPIGRVQEWIADLDSPQYSVREQASKELRTHFDQAAAELRQAVKRTTSAEVRKRINQIIEGAETGAPDPDHLRELRANEVLEQIGTPEARDLLRRLAETAVSNRTVRDAAESLKRLDRR
jgi:WD40 repeat protein